MSSWGHRWRLYKLNRDQRKLDDEGERLFKESRAKGDPTIIDNWQDENYRTLRYLEYARSEMVSASLLKEADKLYLPRPPFDDKMKWQEWVPEPDENDYITRPVLSAEGMTEVRQAIRKERRERREKAESWLKILGAVLGILTGLVGALIGLASVLRHR